MAARDDKTMAGLLRRGLSGTGAAPAGCPDPDLLAAYYDRALEPAEVAHWETHFSTCAHCRAQLAVLARSEPQEARAPRPAWLGSLWWLAPAAALAVIVILAVVRFSPFAHKEVMQSAQTAKAPAAQNPPSQPLVVQNAAAPPEPAPRQQILPRKEAHAARAAGAAGAMPTGTAAPPATAGGIVARKNAVSTLAQNVVQAEKVNPEQGIETRPTTEAKPQTESQNNPVVVSGQAATPPVRILVAPGAAEPAPASAAPSATPEQSENAARRGRLAAGAREAAGRGVGASLKTVESGPIQVIIPTPNVAVVWRIAPDGAIERSTDAGKTWKAQWMNSSGATTDSMVGVSGGAGRIGPALGAGQQLTAGSAVSTKVCWIVGRAGVILRTTDGKHWRKIPAPATANFVSVEARNKRSATVTTADGRVFSTEDGGRTWQPKP